MRPSALPSRWARVGKKRSPEGIKSVIRSETDFTFVLYRTQLFDPDDIENMRKVQAGSEMPDAVGLPRQAGFCGSACH